MRNAHALVLCETKKKKSMITLDDLLTKGYFPKELPPPFTTKKYAVEYLKNRSKFKGYLSFKKDTECINYSVAKVGLIRKTINIPNPSQQSPLCELIVDKWTEIDASINLYRLLKASMELNLAEKQIA